MTISSRYSSALATKNIDILLTIIKSLIHAPIILQCIYNINKYLYKNNN